MPSAKSCTTAAAVVIAFADIEHGQRIALLGGLAEFLDSELEVAAGISVVNFARIGRRAGANDKQGHEDQNPSHLVLLRCAVLVAISRVTGGRIARPGRAGQFGLVSLNRFLPHSRAALTGQGSAPILAPDN
jgi:hypothetical protein